MKEKYQLLWGVLATVAVFSNISCAQTQARVSGENKPLLPGQKKSAAADSQTPCPSAAHKTVEVKFIATQKQPEAPALEQGPVLERKEPVPAETPGQPLLAKGAATAPAPDTKEPAVPVVKDEPAPQVGVLRQSQNSVPPAASTPAEAQRPPQGQQQNPAVASVEYTLGIDDVFQIDVLKPEPLTNLSTVAPDGMISFPYIGSVLVKGRTIAQVQEEIQARLANGYMKYPIVAVALKESRSRKFFVYGEVLKPGPYPIEENMTVLRAISMAGGFSRFGSSSRVKVLRPKKSGPGYDTLKININAIMDGNTNEDLLLTQGDIVVVSEGVF